MKVESLPHRVSAQSFRTELRTKRGGKKEKKKDRRERIDGLGNFVRFAKITRQVEKIHCVERERERS